MSNVKPHVTILGGGIRGTAIAALLTQSNWCQIVLLERDRIASGTTRTNHGRLHCGIGLWRTGLDNIARRHRVGAKLISLIPGVVEEQEPGIYIIQAAEDVDSFEAACRRCLISYKRISSSILNDHGIHNRQFAAIYEIPEYIFNPARLAGRFAAYAKSLGADIHTKSAVYAIEPREYGKFRISLTNGEAFDTNIIINALGNWVNHIHSELLLPHLNLQWHQWRILCLFMPPTSNHVAPSCLVTIIDKDNRSPSAIPHNPWITFGCILEPEYLESPDDEDSGKWRRFDKNHEMDRILLEVNAQHFVSLQSLSPQAISRRLFSFSGVYPRVEGQRESPFQIYQSHEVPNYYTVLGENATTALLDAMDVVKVLSNKLDFLDSRSPDHATQLVKNLMTNIRQEVYPDSSGMIWEDRIDVLISEV